MSIFLIVIGVYLAIGVIYLLVGMLLDSTVLPLSHCLLMILFYPLLWHTQLMDRRARPKGQKPPKK